VKETYKVEGFADLERALLDLPRATAKNAVKRGLIKAAEPIAEAARAGASVRRGVLRKSIIVGTRLKNTAGNAEYRAAMQAGLGSGAATAALRDARREAKGAGSAVEVHVGPGPLPYAHLVEFGSINNRPHPYLRPAWDAHWRGAMESLKDFIWAEIRKAAERAARKAAKLIAKNGT
jgi:HK97 gp10 family phage protein